MSGISRPVIEALEERFLGPRQKLPLPGCKLGTRSKSQAGEKDLVGVGVGQISATPGTQKAHTPAPIYVSMDDIDWVFGEDEPFPPTHLAEPDRFESRVARVTVAVAVIIAVYFAAQLLRWVL